MTDNSSPSKGRRAALQQIAGVGAVAGMLPLLGRFIDDQSAMSLFPSAFAQGVNTGVKTGQGQAVFVSGAQAPAVPMAEWEPPRAGETNAETGGLRIAQGEAAVAKAPGEASRYTARAFDFPAGSLRVLTWKKGTPVMHQITYETQIMVIQGSVTLAPARGMSGPTATLGPGDALFLPSGTLRNMKPAGDTVILQAFVQSTAAKPKRSIVRAKEVKAGPYNAAPGAAKVSTRTYTFDGNSFRWAKVGKGKTNPVAPTRADSLIYVLKGKLRRTEGDQTFDVGPGDAVREMLNTKGHWEVLEEAEFIATDAPFKPGSYSPEMVAKGGGVKLFAMINDENARSRLGFADIPMKKVSDTESLSAPQPAVQWRLGPRPGISPYSRTSKNYTSNNGPYEQHTGGLPHFTGCMAGHIETTLQDGGVLRRCAGEFCYIAPGALHHSNFRSDVPAVYFNLYLPGTDEDTGPLAVKS